jgi:hypothetical protein
MPNATLPADVHADAALGNRRRKKPKYPWGPGAMKFESYAAICKVDESLGLVFGWAMVSKRDGTPYVDVQNDEIPDQAMLEAAADFMAKSRVAKEMHAGDQVGEIVFAFPMTEDIAKALEITTKQYGLLIAMKPSADVLEKFKRGELRGFSVGGAVFESEEVET